MLITAASAGDEYTVTLAWSRYGVKIFNQGDYDGRTAVHLAAASGEVSVEQRHPYHFPTDDEFRA